MSGPTYLDINLVRGDSLAIPLTFLDPLDATIKVDVSGYSLRFTAKMSKFQPDEQANILKDIVLPAEASTGQYTLRLNPEDTSGLNPISYDYDIQLASSDKNAIVTLVFGKLHLSMSASWGA